jgi:predicted Zn-dependent protease
MMGRWLVLACGVAFAHGALHEQIEALGKSITLAPRNPVLYVKRGELHRMHQEWMAAASDFNQALAIDGKTADAVLGLARLANDRGELGRAEKLATEYLKARTASEVGYRLRAEIRARLGQAGAAGDWAMVIRLSNEPGAEDFLGQAEALALSGGDAIAAIDAGVARLGPLVVLDQWAVEYLVKQRRWEAALARQERLVAGAPRKESALTRRAEILLAAGRGAQARAGFQAALAAWEQLPERLRQTKAMGELRARIGAGL